MVQGRFKSGHYRRVQRRVPGGRTVQRYEEQRPQQAHCACGKALPGIPRMRIVEARTTAKTKKRPERPFGGVLCSACMRSAIIKKTR